VLFALQPTWDVWEKVIDHFTTGVLKNTVSEEKKKD
tara:strand:- start:15 stop:122 length:108 start_codon:yes stop_codon:yes gene_type:complete